MAQGTPASTFWNKKSLAKKRRQSSRATNPATVWNRKKKDHAFNLKVKRNSARGIATSPAEFWDRKRNEHRADQGLPPLRRGSVRKKKVVSKNTARSSSGHAHAAPQGRVKHIVRRAGKVVKTYYTAKKKKQPHIRHRAAGQSTLNAPPMARDGYVAQAGRLKDGGPLDPNSMTIDPRLKRKYSLNLENEEERAQGDQHDWAQSTSISSLITGQLRQAANSSLDYWDEWSKDKSGQTVTNPRASSPFGTDVSYNPAGNGGNLQGIAIGEPNPSGPVTMQAGSNPMGAFGTNMVMKQEQEEDGTMHTMAPGQGADGLYNPWSEGEGGQMNDYGMSQDTLATSTMQAMALANAYFAPQRMELAYELGDMETDMRRLSVNLGRQVDDPVLQAKLYKEGMRAVRTMDTQQNTFAFQMAEQRRKEEVQNYQFYNQMAQQEYNLRKANEQFMSRLELDNAYFDLKKDELGMMNAAQNPGTPNTAPVAGTENSPVGGTPPKATTTPTTGAGNITGYGK